MSGQIVASLWAFPWLNDCANGDEADFTFVQTQQTQSLYYFTEPYTYFLVGMTQKEREEGASHTLLTVRFITY